MCLPTRRGTHHKNVFNGLCTIFRPWKSNGPGFKMIGRELKVLEGKENQHEKSAQNGKKALAPYVPQIAVREYFISGEGPGAARRDKSKEWERMESVEGRWSWWAKTKSVDVASIDICQIRKGPKVEKAIETFEKTPEKPSEKVKGRKGPRSSGKRTCQFADEEDCKTELPVIKVCDDLVKFGVNSDTPIDPEGFRGQEEEKKG
ncbi:hypothetical protein K438DRAFT_2176930 [Mycena galopus ATCC 62051]|nr:hypothetical protein K438DRAFT_2176930 [Mycena galopus ATCC 62051]